MSSKSYKGFQLSFSLTNNCHFPPELTIHTLISSVTVPYLIGISVVNWWLLTCNDGPRPIHGRRIPTPLICAEFLITSSLPRRCITLNKLEMHSRPFKRTAVYLQIKHTIDIIRFGRHSSALEVKNKESLIYDYRIIFSGHSSAKIQYRMYTNSIFGSVNLPQSKWNEQFPCFFGQPLVCCPILKAETKSRYLFILYSNLVDNIWCKLSYLDRRNVGSVCGYWEIHLQTKCVQQFSCFQKNCCLLTFSII